MASGNSLVTFSALHGVPPGTVYATQDHIVGASTPAESVPVLDFDASATEYIDFYGILPNHYGGGGLTLTVVFSMSSDHDEGASQVRWEAAFRRLEDDAEDIDTTAHTYDYNGVSAVVPSAVGEVAYDAITFTDGADMDSLAAGEAFILRVKRTHDHADDDATGDAELHAVHVEET